METQEKLLARTMFQLQVYRKKGSSFQDFFVEIMTKFDPEFIPIKPQGSYGDRKNDGFIPSKGIYYQVYSPEDPDYKISNAIKKCKEDFSGLLSYWNDKTPVKEFHFVFNEEYRGAYPEIISTIGDMQKNNPEIKINIFICKDLENIFWELSKDNQIAILSFIPEPEKIETIDYEALTEAINFLLENQKPISIEKGLNVPDFLEKIKFNKLSNIVSSLLTSASQQVSALEDYFGANSDFSRQQLQKKFIALYNEGLEYIKEDVENRNDLIFFYILKSGCPKETKQVQDAVLVLMSYFFEACDIFEEPI